MFDVKLGKIVHEDWEESMFSSIDQYIQPFDELLTQELIQHQGLFSEHYVQLLKQRGVSFQEFLKLFTSFSEKSSHKHMVFQFLQIASETIREQWTLKYSSDQQGYKQFVQDFGLYQDLLNDELPQVHIPFSMFYKHCYINGASGSGKSTIVKNIVNQIVKTDSSILMIDPQGILSEEVSRLKTIAPDRLVYLKPMLSKDSCPVINVLDDDGRSISAKSLQLARTIKTLTEEELSNAMMVLLLPCIYTLIEHQKFSLRDLKTFVDPRENKALIELGLKSSNVEFKSTFSRLNEGYFNRTRDALMTKFDRLYHDQIFKILTTGQSTVKLPDLLESGKVLILNLEGMDFESKQAFGGLVTSLVVGHCMTREVTPTTKRTFLVLDEVQNFLTADIVKVLDEARQKKLHLIAANQRIGQLKSQGVGMQENFIDAMMGNTAIKIIGHNDSTDTINILSSKLGVSKELLTQIPDYEFILRVRGQQDIHFRSSNDINNPELYHDDDEYKKLLNSMMERYYAPLGSSQRTNILSDQNLDDAISVTLDDSDF